MLADLNERIEQQSKFKLAEIAQTVLEFLPVLSRYSNHFKVTAKPFSYISGGYRQRAMNAPARGLTW
jgi:hypothetical protein